MKRLIPLSLAVVAAGVLVTSYFLQALPETKPAGRVYDVEVTPRDLEVDIKAIGTLHASKAHMISSDISGEDAKIIFLAEDGTFVSEGELLVRFDPVPFEQKVLELNGRVESLRAAAQATAQLVEWEKNEAGQKQTTAEFNHQVALLDLDRLVQGEGPMNLYQYRNEMEKASLELKQHEAYEVELKKLEDEGISNPAELDQVAEEIKSCKEKLELATLRYESFRDYVLPTKIENARAKVKNTELMVQQTKQGNIHKIAKSIASLNEVKAKLRNVETALAKAEKELEKTELKAPFDGLIVHHWAYRDGEMRTPREGDSVIINQPIMYFPDISSLVVKSRVKEVDLHKVRVGQKATTRIDAYPDLAYSSTLSFIGALAETAVNQERGQKYFQVIYTLETPDDRLRPGMSARVVLHVAQLSDVLSVPLQSVFHDRSGYYCFLKNGIDYEKRYITIGSENEDFTEVLDGLEAGDIVSLVNPHSM